MVSNKKGWFAAVQNSAGVFGMFSCLVLAYVYMLIVDQGAVLSPLSDLRKSLREATRDNCSFTPQRTLSFSTSEPNVLALACNDSRLIVGFKSGQVIAYDTSSVFTSGFNEITPIHVFQSSQQPILDIAPNPNGEDVNLSNLLVVLRGDGTVQILNSSLEPQGGWATGDADSAPVAGASFCFAFTSRILTLINYLCSGMVSERQAACHWSALRRHLDLHLGQQIFTAEAYPSHYPRLTYFPYLACSRTHLPYYIRSISTSSPYHLLR